MKRIVLAVLIPLFIASCGQKAEKGHEEGEHKDEPGIVHLKKESQSMIGFEVMKAKKAKLESAIDAVGEIAQETENVTHVTSPEGGVLKKYLVRPGDVVEKEMPLCLIQTKTGGEIEIKSPSHGIVLAHYIK
ncbi:MAG: hypothetical protein ACRENF_06945, partial [Thermodesulfobacteriota bacterium]